MHLRTPRTIARLTLGAALVTGAFVAVAPLPAPPIASAAPSPTPSSTVVYDSIDDPFPANVPSYAFQARSVDEFGDVVQLAPGPRRLDSITVAMSSWACESGSGASCATTPGASFTHPITANVYEYDGGAVGALVASVTADIAVPYRPSADPTCSGGSAWRASNGNCYNGFLFPATFEFPSLPDVPDRLVWSIAFNTQTHGASPIGSAGPYNSLNVGLSALADPLVGTDVDDSGFVTDTTWTGNLCDGGAGGTDTLRVDSPCWTGYRPMARIETLAASEATSTVVVDDANTDWGFATDGTPFAGQTGQYAVGPDTAPLGAGSAAVGVSATNEGSVLGTSMLGGTKLADITELAYSSYQPEGTLAVSLQFSVHLTDAASGWQGRLVYEPVYATNPVPAGWQRWDTLQGRWWISNAAGGACAPNHGGGYCTWAELLAAFPEAHVNDLAPQVLFKVGSGVSAFTGNVDHLTIGVDDGAGNITTTNYDFEPTSPACVTTESTLVTDVAELDDTDIRSKGHFEVVDGGARLWTDDNSSQAKVAGYVDAPGARIGSSFDIDWTGTSPPPGAQIVLSDDSILVGESVYGNVLWTPASHPAAAYAPHTTGGGYGSSFYGTPAEWQAAITAEGVTVAQVGFSLGSGVLGDGVLTSVTAGCHTITFDLPTPPTHTPDYNPVTPTRLFDTRPAAPPALRSVAKRQVGPSNPVEVKVTDLSGGLVPATGVGAVSLNVTATNAGRYGYVTVTPCAPVGEASSVNFQAGADRANLVVVPVSGSGKVCFTSDVPVDLVVDVNGWFAASQGFVPVTPTRVFDTRPGTPPALRTVAKGEVGPSSALKVKLTDLPGGLVPATGVGAVSLNVTATGAGRYGYVTVTPCGPVGEASNVNFQADTDTANAVLTPVSASGEVCFTSDVDVHLVVDVNGWFTSASDFSAVTPTRVFDTRPGTPPALRSVTQRQVGPSTPLKVKLTDLPGGLVPATGVGAVSLTMTATNAGHYGYVTVTPCGPIGEASNVNFQVDTDTANAVLTPVSASGEVCFTSDVPVDLVVDVNGWFAD